MRFAAVEHDFDGNARMDLLLRHSVTGALGLWSMNGTPGLSAVRCGRSEPDS